MQRAEVMIKGPGLGRDAALRAIRRKAVDSLVSYGMYRTPSRITYRKKKKEFNDLIKKDYYGSRENQRSIDSDTKVEVC